MVWFRNRTIILKGLHFLYSRSRNQTELSPGIQTQATDRLKRKNVKAREEKAEAESVANAAEGARLAAEALNLENEASQRLAEKEAKEGAERAARKARLRDIAGKHYAANQVVRYEPNFLTDFTLQPHLKREPSVLKALMTQKNIRRTMYVYVRFIGNFAKFMAKRLMNLNSAHLNLITL
jgi:hypothetical protein